MGAAQRCWIKKTDSRQRESALTPGILTMDEYRKFWLTWHGGQVKLGRDGYTDSIISCPNDIQDMKYVTFSVVEHRNPVHWRFERKYSFIIITLFELFIENFALVCSASLLLLSTPFPLSHV